MATAKEFYAFPTAKELAAATDEDLRRMGAGYRAEYIADTARRIADGYDIAKF